MVVEPMLFINVPHAEGTLTGIICIKFQNVNPPSNTKIKQINIIRYFIILSIYMLYQKYICLEILFTEINILTDA